MGYFISKNLCDKISNIKNLRLQFSCIFRRDRRGILRFSVGEVFMEKFAIQNCHFFDFQKNRKKANFKRKNTIFFGHHLHYFIT